MNQQKLLLPATLLMASFSMAQAADLIDWDFSDPQWTTNNVQVLKDAGFAVSTAADSDTHFFVDDDPAGVLTLLKNPLIAGSVAANKALGQSLTSGTINFRAAVAGDRDPLVGQILLFGGGEQLGGVQLRDTDTLRVTDARNDNTNVLPSGVSLADFNDFSMSWTSDSDGQNGVFTILLNATQLLSSTTLAFQNVGVVDTVQLGAGFSSATNDRILLMENLSVSGIPEPSSYALILGFGMLGLVVSRRRTRK
jgi:hypothetical protein